MNEGLRRKAEQFARHIARQRAARLEARARVALMFFRLDQVRWAYYPGETEPRLWVEL